jgi:membrane-associated phospholipid phosphatase
VTFSASFIAVLLVATTARAQTEQDRSPVSAAEPRVTAATLPLETSLLERPALAYPVRSRRPYALVPALDAAVLLAGATLWIAPENMLYDLVPLGRCPCDPARLNALDRPVAGLNVPGTGPLSNVFTAALLVLPSAIDLFDVRRTGGSIPEWVEDTIVIGEALIVGGAFAETAKLAFQRPRPQAYGIDPGDPRLGDPDTYMSFYSVAAAEVFTGAIAGAMTYAIRHPHGPGRWLYLAAAELAATGFGLSRVLFGRHFPTDVIAAAAMGTLIGVMVPWLHRRETPVVFGAAVTPGIALVTATLRM